MHWIQADEKKLMRYKPTMRPARIESGSCHLKFIALIAGYSEWMIVMLKLTRDSSPG